MARAKKIPLITDFNHIPAEALVPEEDQPYPLPAHWKWVRLGSVVTFQGGGTPDKAKPTFWNGDIPWASVKDLSTPVVVETQDHISKQGLSNSSANLCSAGDLLLATRIDPGRVSISQATIAINQDLKIVRSEVASVPYLYFWFKGAKNWFDTNSSGTTVKGVTLTKLNAMPFLLPPLEEQKQIVAYLDEKLGKIDSAREKLEDFLDHADKRKDNLIQAGVTGHLTSHWREEHNAHLNDWQLKQISDLGEVVTGSTPSTKNPEYYGGQFPFVKPADLDAGRYIKSAQSFLSQAGAKVSRMLPAKTVAVCCIGSLGKCGLIEVPAATNQQINSIIPRSGTHAVYLYYLCSSPKFKAAMIEKSSSTTLSILNKSRFSKLEFSIPTMGEQEEIARILDEQLECIERTDKLVAEVLERLDTMKQQIVSAALAGRLSLQIS